MRSTLLIPLIVGLGASVFALYSLLKVVDDAKEKAARPVEFADVIVAKLEIPYAAKITEEMLQTVRVPKPHPLQHTLGSTDVAAGRVAAMRIVRGAPVLSNMLAAKGTPPGAANLIAPGLTTVAATFPASDVGDLEPGDRVDVMYAAKRTRTTQSQMGLLFSNVEIFSVGDKRIGMGMAVPGAEPANQGGQRASRTSTRGGGGSTTVKLLLPWEKASVFGVAKLNGDFELFPRRFDDNTQRPEMEFSPQETPVAEEVRTEQPVALPPPPAPPERRIRVFQGAKDVSEDQSAMRNEVGGTPVEASPTVTERKPAPSLATGSPDQTSELIERRLQTSQERRASADIGE